MLYSLTFLSFFSSQGRLLHLELSFCFHCSFKLHTLNCVHVLLNMRYCDKNLSSLETTTYSFRFKHRIKLVIKLFLIIKRHVFKRLQDDHTELLIVMKRDHTLSLIIKQHVFKHVQDGNKAWTRLSNQRSWNDHIELPMVIKYTYWHMP